MTITLPIYYEIQYKTKPNKTILCGLNWYRNVHHHLSNKIKVYYHQLVKEQVLDTKFDQIRPKYKVYLKNKLTDGHNVRSVLEKFALDGLVENGNIIDDNINYVPGDEGSEYFIDKDNPRIEIYL